MAVAAAVAPVATAQAGMITQAIGPATGPGLGKVVIKDIMITTPSPNNSDVTTASDNQITDLTKTFAKTDFIDLRFKVMNTGGTTEYFVDETAQNRTPGTWGDYHFLLGFGTGAKFKPSSEFDFLTFDEPDFKPTPTSGGAFAKLDTPLLTDEINWSGGPGVKPKEDVNFTFSLHIPDANTGIPKQFFIKNPAGLVVGFEFTLREIPSLRTIPEPSTLSMATVSVSVLLAVIAARRRGQRRRAGPPGRPA
jgi:hypothetical protein